MKLFLIIYMGTQLGAVAGPLPFDMKECEARRDSLRAQQAEVLKTGVSPTKGKLSLEALNRIRSLRFECKYYGKRPSGVT